MHSSISGAFPNKARVTWLAQPVHGRGDALCSPIRTNLSIVALCFIEGKPLCRHSWFLLAEEFGLPHRIDARRPAPPAATWTRSWLICAVRAAPGPGQSAQSTASPPTPALLPASAQTTEACMSSARPAGRRGAWSAPCSPPLAVSRARERVAPLSPTQRPFNRLLLQQLR